MALKKLFSFNSGISTKFNSALLCLKVNQFHSVPAFLASNKEKPALPTEPEQSASSLFSQTLETIDEGESTSMSKSLEKEYRFSTSNFKISLRKLNDLANQITGLSVKQALLQMKFSQKRASEKIMHNLAFAHKNAQLQKNFDADRMFIQQAWVGKGNYITKLIDIKGRGRFGLKQHPFCHMKFIFKEKPAEKKLIIEGMKDRRKIKGFKLRQNVWMPHREERPIYNPKAHYNW